jgi:mRNA interferase HigB
MRIIAKRTLREFWQIHPDAEQPLKSWFREMELGNWPNLNKLKEDYPSASILKDNRVVFNIKGNHYRLIAKFTF